MKAGCDSHFMGSYELQSPILLGVDFETDGAKQRFFGELSNLRIWSNKGNLEEEEYSKHKQYIIDWDTAKIYVDDIFKEHVIIKKEAKEQIQSSRNTITWIQKHPKSFQSGFADCEKLGGSPLYSTDPDTLLAWDKADLCNYFWFPVKFQTGKWLERNSNTEVEKVTILKTFRPSLSDVSFIGNICLEKWQARQ